MSFENKSIIIRDNEAVIEGNLIDIPVFYFHSFNKKTIEERKQMNLSGVATKNTRPTVMEYIWTDSKGYEHGVKIKGDAEYGVPGEYEYNVLMAFWRIYSKKYSQLTIFNGGITNISPEIEFSYTEIAETMGMNNLGGANLKRIKEAINILTATTITNSTKSGLHCAGTLKNEEESYHIIEYSKAQGFNDIDGRKITGKVVISKFFFENICNNYFKIIDYDRYISLKSIIARRMYLILSKWRNARNAVYLKYETLYNRIPLTEGENKKKNQNIKNAAKHLISCGFLTDFETDRKGIKFIFTKEENKNIDTSKNEVIPFNLKNIKKPKKPYSEMAEILQGLESCGLVEEEIYEALRIREREYLAALLRYVDERRMGGTLTDNPKNFLLKGIHKLYDLDEKYYA